MGETTAAVPQPHASSMAPASTALTNSSTENRRSLTLCPLSRSSWRIERRVTPGSTVPVSSVGVTTSPLILNMTFMLPTSSIYCFDAPSSHSTCEMPFSSARIPARCAAA